MNAYRVDKDRGEDVDKIGGCPRVLVVEQRGARHGINVWPPRQNIHARLPRRTPRASPSPITAGPGPSTPRRPSRARAVPFSSRAFSATVSGVNPKIIASRSHSLITGGVLPLAPPPPPRAPCFLSIIISLAVRFIENVEKN